MKPLVLFTLFLSLGITSCNNDDDTTTLVQEPAASLEGAIASISHLNLATIDLETGNTIVSAEDTFEQNITYDNTFIGIYDNRIIRSSATDFLGEQEWEIPFNDPIDITREISGLNTVAHDGVLYYSYRLINSITFESTHFLEARDLTDGSILWITSESEEVRRLAVLNNRLIVINGNSVNSIFTSRRFIDGDIMATWEIPERISHLIPGINEVMVMSWSNKIYSIQEDLSVNWIFETAGSNVRRGIVTNNEFIFHSRDEFIYALNIESGEINWSQHLADLFIKDLYFNQARIWSVTQDFNNNVLVINEFDAISGTLLSNFSIPAFETSEAQLFNFDDYIFILSDQDTGATITQLLNYKTQELLWQNEIGLNNVFLPEANILLGNTRIALSSF